MKYKLSQAELQKAVEYYLNEKVLREPITVSAVEPSDKGDRKLGINYVLHVTVTDDQSHLKAVNE